MSHGPARSSAHPTQLAPRLGLFDLTMLCMGSIIGTSIFIVPQVVAKNTDNLMWALGAWLLGGATAIGGALVSAELAARRPLVGGSYVYLRDAYHPAVAFLYGWCLLLVVQTGAMASVAVIFARYLNQLIRAPIPEGVITTVVIAVLSLVNCLGVRTGSTVQNVLMSSKIVVILSLIACGWLFTRSHSTSPVLQYGTTAGDWEHLSGFGAAMVSVLFCYGGCQMAAFLAGEVKRPEINVPRGLVLGVFGVVLLYLGVNVICIRVLGPALADSPTPASAVMRIVFGERGAALVAAGIALSALGYISQATLTSPRVYYAMAVDGVFFRNVAWLHPRTRVPIVAILMQGVWAILIALSGKYHEILNYVVSVDIIFTVLIFGSIFIFRRRDARTDEAGVFRMPGHPLITAVMIAIYVGVGISLFYKFPANGIAGLTIAAAGIPVYFFWRRRQPSNLAEDGALTAHKHREAAAG